MAQQIKRQAEEYLVPAPLVHRLIISIFAALIGLAGYMVIWALNDVKWKSKQESRLDSIMAEQANMKDLLEVGVLPRADERLKALERFLRKEIELVTESQRLLQRDLREWGTGLRATITELQSSIELHRNDTRRHGSTRP